MLERSDSYSVPGPQSSVLAIPPHDQADCPAQAVAELGTEAQVAAVLHPVRRRMLACLAERAASPAEVARLVGIAPQLSNYHMRALEAAGLVEQTESVRRRNLLEHRFRAIARAFTLSSALPLTDEQRARLQSDAALQQVVAAGDTIRADAMRLLDAHAEPVPAAAVEVEVTLRDDAERARFLDSLIQSVRAAAAPYQPTAADRGTVFRTHLAIYPLPTPPEETP